MRVKKECDYCNNTFFSTKKWKWKVTIPNNKESVQYSSITGEESRHVVADVFFLCSEECWKKFLGYTE